MHIAFLIHELTPYRIHLLRRFRQELTLQTLHVLLTSQTGGFDWQLTRPPNITWHDFGQSATIIRQGHLSQLFRERAKGRRIAAKLDELRPSAVVVCGYGDAAHRYVIRHCHRHHIPVLLWADSNIRSEPSRGLRRALKHLLLPRLLRQCSAVLPWGTLGRQYFLKYGVPENRIFTVPAEPDYALIENTPPAAIEAARQSLQLDPNRHRILFVGRLAPEKRVDLLLAAFAHIAPGRPEWDLLIVGDGPLRDSLQASVPPPLRPRITWAGAMTTPETLAPMYHLAHLFVLPSDHEPWGIVVNEAAAAGLPLVLSDIVGAGGDLLTEGVNGSIFPHGDAESLSPILANMTSTALSPTSGNRSREILAHWRTMADPVRGLTRAIEFCGAV